MALAARLMAAVLVVVTLFALFAQLRGLTGGTTFVDADDPVALVALWAVALLVPLAVLGLALALLLLARLVEEVTR